MTTKEYNTCVSNWADDIFRYASRIVSNVEIGRDVSQDVFEKVWNMKDSIQFETAKSYLYRTAYNACMDLLRKNQVSQRYENHATRVEKSETPNRFELQDLLNNALNQISEVQRSLILLRDFEGYSYQEIGEITGLSESQVKVYIFRGRKALKSIIQEMDYHEQY